MATGVGVGGGVVPPATVIGTRATVPVDLPVTSRVVAPPGVPAGMVTSTDAVPYSSKMSVAGGVVDREGPQVVPLSETLTVASLVSAAVVMASEVRPKVTWAPMAYDAPVRRPGTARPTARCE